jgi:hypothetical protein
MPFAPDIPPTKDVVGPEVEKNLDTYHIVSMNIQVDPNDAAKTSVKIVWAKGYMDSGNFVQAESHSEHLAGQDVIDKIGEATSGGSIYNEVKYAAWELLQARGIVPAGTIS